jgi:hypothetical protein
LSRIMNSNFTQKLNHMLKKTIISSLMIGAVALAVASSGGGDKKKEARKAEFTPIRTTNGFTLRAGPTYTGSLTFGRLRNNNMITYNTVVTYQKGNSIYILPRHTRLSAAATPTFRSNLNLLDLKFRLHK